jgi:restriction endonuclease Mrr
MIPDYQSLVRPVLEHAAKGEVRISDLIQSLSDELGLSTEERTELLPSGKQTKGRHSLGGMDASTSQTSQADLGVTLGEENAFRQLGPQRSGDGRGPDQSRSLTALEGAPRHLQGPIPEHVSLAERYPSANGIDLRRQVEYAQVAPALLNALQPASHAVYELATTPSLPCPLPEARRQNHGLF